MNGVKAVVFDMDGVIFDSEKLVVDCWVETANQYGIADVEMMCQKCLGLNRVATKEVFLEHYGQSFPYDTYKQEMSDLYHKRAREGALVMKPGVVELLTFLKEQDIKIALASSTRQQVVTWELTDAGIINYFDEIDREVEVVVKEDAIETYDAPYHNRDEYNEMALKLMKQAGVRVE